MSITPTPKEALLDAMARFDRDLRPQSSWTGWEANKAHRWAIENDGRRYPVKQIISMASGDPVKDFYGGPEANSFITERGLNVVELRPRVAAGDGSLSRTLAEILNGYLNTFTWVDDHRNLATCAAMSSGRRWKVLKVRTSAPSRSSVVG